MEHVIVRIIELAIAIAMTTAVIGMFVLGAFSVVHGLRAAGRHR